MRSLTSTGVPSCLRFPRDTVMLRIWDVQSAPGFGWRSVPVGGVTTLCAEQEPVLQAEGCAVPQDPEYEMAVHALRGWARSHEALRPLVQANLRRHLGPGPSPPWSRGWRGRHTQRGAVLWRAVPRDGGARGRQVGPPRRLLCGSEAPGPCSHRSCGSFPPRLAAQSYFFPAVAPPGPCASSPDPEGPAGIPWGSCGRRSRTRRRCRGHRPTGWPPPASSTAPPPPTWCGRGWGGGGRALPCPPPAVVHGALLVSAQRPSLNGTPVRFS